MESGQPEFHEQQAALHLAAVELNPDREHAALRVRMAEAHAALALAITVRHGRLG